MTDENKQQLTALRDRVLQSAMPLVAQGDISPEQKFLLYMTAGRTHGNSEAFSHAFEAVQGFSDDSMKVDALMELVEEIDLILQDDLYESAEESVDQPAASQEDVADAAQLHYENLESEHQDLENASAQ